MQSEDTDITVLELLETVDDLAEEDAPVVVRLPDGSVRYACFVRDDPLAADGKVLILGVDLPFRGEH